MIFNGTIRMPLCRILRRKCTVMEISYETQEAQGLGALLDKMEDNDHIKMDNIEI